MELSRLGFRFRLEGEAVKVRFDGEQKPDPAAVSPLLDLVRRHKEDVRFFLKCHCPRCGGVVFVGDECFLCDWAPRTTMEEVLTQAPQGEVVSTCGSCAHFTPSRLNPAQGFGCCALAHLSKRPGAHPGKAACPHFEAQVGEGSLRLIQ
jgi:hypothetical protein